MKKKVVYYGKNVTDSIFNVCDKSCFFSLIMAAITVESINILPKHSSSQEKNRSSRTWASLTVRGLAAYFFTDLNLAFDEHRRNKNIPPLHELILVLLFSRHCDGSISFSCLWVTFVEKVIHSIRTTIMNQHYLLALTERSRKIVAWYGVYMKEQRRKFFSFTRQQKGCSVC